MSTDTEREVLYPTERDFRWSQDGQHLIIRQENTLLAIGLDNRVDWEEVVFCPGDLDEMERFDGPYAYEMLAVLPEEEGNRYIHSLHNVTEEKNENGEGYLGGSTAWFLYDERTGENLELEGVDLAWSEWPDDIVNPQRTHYRDGFEEVRVLPLP